MRLASPARYSIAITKRVQGLLDFGCECGADAATLTRRLIAGAVTIHLQCDGCGRSLGGALPRNEFYGWQSYPEWDNALIERYEAEQSAEWQRQRDAYDAAGSLRREEYAQWLRSSPEWHELRFRVMRRANRLCEACLKEPPIDVHHGTYAMGRLPPAFELHAVCRACHERLHGGWRTDEGV